MKVTIEKGIARGEVTAPPSKSAAHRLLISAALSSGKSVVRGVSDCEDVRATVRCLRALGAEFEINGCDYTVHGISTSRIGDAPIFDCGESGSTLRFILPIASIYAKNATFIGAGRLMQRPMSVYEEIFRERELYYNSDGEKIALSGALSAGEYRVAGNVSSQFISGLIFALPLLSGDSYIKITPPIESASYINLTLDAVRQFGISAYFVDECRIKIPGSQVYRPTEVTVEGDYSGAAFIEALNLFSGSVKVLGLNPESLQGDKIYAEHFKLLKEGAPTINIENCPDSGPIYFAVAAALNGATFTGTKRLKIKESDRAAVMAEELSKFGVKTEVYEDSVIVHKTALKTPSETLFSHNDHRIVMALSVLLTLVGGEICGAEAIKKSYPDFFDALIKLGIGVRRDDL